MAITWWLVGVYLGFIMTIELPYAYLLQKSCTFSFSVAYLLKMGFLQVRWSVISVCLGFSPQTGEFSGENIRLGSRGDSYYEYLIKVWLQNPGSNLTYLHDMYKESVEGIKELLVKKSVPSGLVFVGELPYGLHSSFSPKMDHLVCWPLILYFWTLVYLP